MILSRRSLLLGTASLAAAAALPAVAADARPMGIQVFALPGPNPKYILAHVVREGSSCVAYRTLELTAPRYAVKADTPELHNAFIHFMAEGNYKWPHTAAIADFSRRYLDGAGDVCKVSTGAFGDLYAEGYGRIRFENHPKKRG